MVSNAIKSVQTSTIINGWRCAGLQGMGIAVPDEQLNERLRALLAPAPDSSLVFEEEDDVTEKPG